MSIKVISAHGTSASAHFSEKCGSNYSVGLLGGTKSRYLNILEAVVLGCIEKEVYLKSSLVYLVALDTPLTLTPPSRNYKGP